MAPSVVSSSRLRCKDEMFVSRAIRRRYVAIIGKALGAAVFGARKEDGAHKVESRGRVQGKRRQCAVTSQLYRFSAMSAI